MDRTRDRSLLELTKHVRRLLGQDDLAARLSRADSSGRQAIAAACATLLDSLGPAGEPQRDDAVVVHKFGGSSLADIASIQKVASYLAKAHRRGDRMVVVASAMGCTTDGLIEQARSLTASPAAAALDALLASGEQVASSLLSIALEALGVPAVALTGAEAGIETDGVHGCAQIVDVVAVQVVRQLAEGRVVVVAGYQGAGPTGAVTTLGRGGSDLSAVALAAALGQKVCRISTDCAGVFTGDPRVVTDARKLDELTFDEMFELAHHGAGVLQAEAVDLARRNDVAIHVSESCEDGDGTWVRAPAEDGFLDPRPKAVTGRGNLTRIIADGTASPADVGRLLALVHGEVFVLSVSPVDLLICPGTVPAVADLVDRLRSTLRTAIAIDTGLGMVTVVGGAFGSGSLAWNAHLEQLGVTVKTRFGTALTHSWVIKADEVDRAVRSLHHLLFIDHAEVDIDLS